VAGAVLGVLVAVAAAGAGLVSPPPDEETLPPRMATS
jgi:hypothetical protein